MKTLNQLIGITVLATSTLAFAGPPPAYFNHSPAVSHPTLASTSELSTTAENTNMMCDRMWVRNNNPKQSPYHVVKCTAAMMQYGDCQRACAAVANR